MEDKTSKFSWMKRLVGRRHPRNDHPAPERHVPAEIASDESDLYEDDTERPSLDEPQSLREEDGTVPAPPPQQQRVQIVDSKSMSTTMTTNNDGDSVSSTKRRSNSNFTVPSVSHTSITTITPPPSEVTTLTVPNSTANMDNASVITIASSSKRAGRRSFDTNASTRAIAPESILSRRESGDSLTNGPFASNKSISAVSIAGSSLRRVARTPTTGASIASVELPDHDEDDEDLYHHRNPRRSEDSTTP